MGRNVRIDTRWAAGDTDLRKYVWELIALGPDVVVAFTSTALPPFTRELVLEDWPAIEALAAALLKRNTLSYDEALAAICETEQTTEQTT
jgi:hypothetical protein